jgi:hypothetical protein
VTQDLTNQPTNQQYRKFFHFFWIKNWRCYFRFE